VKMPWPRMGPNTAQKLSPFTQLYISVLRTYSRLLTACGAGRVSMW
jgi:hypothetical protein